MAAKKREFATVRIIGWSSITLRYRERYRMQWRSFIGKKVSHVISMMTRYEQAQPPFLLNRQPVLRNSAIKLKAGDVLAIKMKR